MNHILTVGVIYAGKLSLIRKKITSKIDFTGVQIMVNISKESILLISVLLKCLIYAILETVLMTNQLFRPPCLLNVLVLFVTLAHFVIIEEGISFLLASS